MRPPASRAAGGAGGSAGFVLAEALVAFAVLAVGLGLMVTGMAVALRADGRAASSRDALRQAQALLARAGVAEPLAPSDLRGETPGGLRWRVSVTRMRPAPAGARPRPRDAAPVAAGPAPFWVAVTVWTPDGAEVALAGLKLGPAA